MICYSSFSLEKSKNALNVVRQSQTSHKVNFVVICENEATPDEHYTNVVWINKSISNKEFARIINETFNKISLEENQISIFTILLKKELI